MDCLFPHLLCQGMYYAKLGMRLHPLLHVSQDIRRGHVQGVTQLIQQPDAGTVPSKLYEGDVVAIHIGAKRQVCLTPLSFCTQVA